MMPADNQINECLIDGTLEMKVRLDQRKDELECDEANPSDYEDSNTLHVMEYMTLFKVDIDLEYKILDGMYCDRVDENLKIEVTNYAGYDKYSGSEQFKSSIPEGSLTDIALQLCNPLFNKSPCLFPVVHDRDDEGNNIGKARVETLQFATGRPNIVKPYTKSIIFKVIGGDADVEHKASIFISGLFSKGPGESFALPTHKPIMILRDPPGELYKSIHVLSST